MKHQIVRNKKMPAWRKSIQSKVIYDCLDGRHFNWRLRVKVKWYQTNVDIKQIIDAASGWFYCWGKQYFFMFIKIIYFCFCFTCFSPAGDWTWLWLDFEEWFLLKTRFQRMASFLSFILKAHFQRPAFKGLLSVAFYQWLALNQFHSQLLCGSKDAFIINAFIINVFAKWIFSCRQ